MAFAGQYTPNPGYFQTTPAQVYQQTPTTPVYPQPTTNLVWVQGEQGANDYQLAPNSSVILLDKDAPIIYIKSTDAVGRANPIEKYHMVSDAEYAKITAPAPDYITREEFEKFVEEANEKFSLKRAKS